MLTRFCLLLLPLASLALLAGCGSDAATSVSGAVTYNGEVVEHGVVSFQPADGGVPFGASVVNGRYESKEARPGQFTAVIQSSTPPAVTGSREAFQQQAAAPKKEVENYIPENAQGNGQTVDIQAGEQTLDFALTGPARK